MEFPPIVVDGSVYFMRNNGGTYRLDADTGKVKWKNQIGKLSASSPAYSDGRLFVTLAVGQGHRAAGPQRQAPVAEAARQPHRVLADRAPRRRLLRHRGRRPLRAVRQDRPREVEVQRLAARSRRRPRCPARPLYVGDYSGRMYAVWATHRPRALVDRHLRLAVRLRRRQLLLDARGRVRPRLRRQHRRQGLLVRARRRRRSPGPSRPAATSTPPPPSRTCRAPGRPSTSAPTTATCTRSTRAPAPRAGPRAAAAASRAVRPWSGRIVYFADLDSKSTYGVDARTGERVFKRSRGYYNPVVSDGQRLYMTGYASVTALDPVKQAAPRPPLTADCSRAG